MKKLITLQKVTMTLLFTLMYSAQALAGATWVGNSAINVNGTWYYCGANLGSWCTGGAFNGATIGPILTLEIGGQSQVAADNGDWKSGTLVMHYKIDNGSWNNHNLSYESYGHGQYGKDMRFQSGGTVFTSASIDISKLSAGNHTLSIYFGPLDGNYDSNNSSNYVATFTIPDPQTIPFTDTYGTFSSVYPLNFPENDPNVMAYKATVSDGKVVMSHITGVVPANTGLFVKKISDAATVTVSPAATPTANMTGNLLVAGTTSGVPATGDGIYNYVFGKNTQGYGFFNANVAISVDMTGKAYLSSTTALTAPNASRIALVFDDETTGIEAIDVTPETVKEGAREYYNLNGQRVMNPTKGLYIVNGKKVIIK